MLSMCRFQSKRELILTKKDPLIWNRKLRIIMYQIQEMTSKKTLKDKLVVIALILHIISFKFKSTPNCPVPKHSAYQLACEMK